MLIYPQKIRFPDQDFSQGGIMKNITSIISVLSCFASLSFAAESQSLTQQAMESVQQQTRAMSAMGIPEAQAQKMLTQMVQNRYQKQNIIRAQQVVTDTAKAGLPTEPVMSKAMEGMAKHASQNQVILAMETVRSRYAYANRLARSLSDDNENIDTMTQAIADSMAAGMKAENLESVMAQLQVRTQNQQQTRNKSEDKNLAVQTMQTIRTMARLGVPPSDVSDTLCQALQNQYTYQEMKQLHHKVSKQAQSTSPHQNTSRNNAAVGKGGSSGGGSGSGGGGSGSGGGSK
jgi:hypothetical protein